MLKPAEINTKSWVGSDFRSCEVEMVGANIVILSKKENEWKPMSWDEYCSGCAHEINHYDRSGWNELIERGYMDPVGDTNQYIVTEAFHSVIKKFANVPRD